MDKRFQNDFNNQINLSAFLFIPITEEYVKLVHLIWIF